MPIRNGADHKRSFIASRQEAQRVERYARLIRAGLLKTREQKRRERAKKRERSFYMMWSTDDAEDQSMRRITDHIPAPKRNLPSHAESYNPPPEFLFNEREVSNPTMSLCVCYFVFTTKWVCVNVLFFC